MWNNSLPTNRYLCALPFQMESPAYSPFTPGSNASRMVEEGSRLGSREAVAAALRQSVPSMARTLKLRASSEDERDEWRSEFEDIIAASPELVAAYAQPPTLSEVGLRWPGMDEPTRSHAFSIVLDEYQHLNYLIWRIARPAIDIDGPMKKLDAQYIQRTFVQDHLRDGAGLVRWALSFDVKGVVDDQLDLQDKLRRLTLSASANREEIALFLDEMLTTWLAIDGNRADKPDPYIQMLLLAMPTKPDTSFIVKIRSWIVDKRMEQDPLITGDMYQLTVALPICAPENT